MYTVFVSCYACVRVRENVSTPEDLLPSARQPAHGLGSLRYSLAVTHPGTNRGGRCLTSLIETNVVPLRHTALVALKNAEMFFNCGTNNNDILGAW